MVDTKLLESKIKTSGKTKTYLSRSIGCSLQSLRLKCLNKYDFKSAEIQKLCDELSITNAEEMQKIFFKK